MAMGGRVLPRALNGRALHRTPGHGAGVHCTPKMLTSKVHALCSAATDGHPAAGHGTRRLY